MNRLFMSLKQEGTLKTTLSVPQAGISVMADRQEMKQGFNPDRFMESVPELRMIDATWMTLLHKLLFLSIGDTSFTPRIRIEWSIVASVLATVTDDTADRNYYDLSRAFMI